MKARREYIKLNNIPEVISIKNFRDLKVYQVSMELSDKIYEIVKQFPDSEKWNLSLQMCRCCNSVSANVAEGNGQVFIKKQFSFLNNSLGSASELRCHLEHSYRRGYINKSTYEYLEEETITIIKMLLGMMKKIKNELG